MMTKKIAAMLLFIGLALTGCASTGEDDYYELRESRVGQHRDILISEIGEPTIQLAAPATFDSEMVRYVYMNQVDEGGCVDIYVIEKESGSIVEYICQ